MTSVVGAGMSMAPGGLEAGGRCRDRRIDRFRCLDRAPAAGGGRGEAGGEARERPGEAGGGYGDPC